MGGATLETVRAYVDAQGTEEHARKAAAKAKKPTASARSLGGRRISAEVDLVMPLAARSAGR